MNDKLLQPHPQKHEMAQTASARRVARGRCRRAPPLYAMKVKPTCSARCELHVLKDKLERMPKPPAPLTPSILLGKRSTLLRYIEAIKKQEDEHASELDEKMAAAEAERLAAEDEEIRARMKLDLEILPLRELKDECRELRLSSAGRKADLVARLLKYAVSVMTPADLASLELDVLADTIILLRSSELPFSCAR